MEWPSYPLTTPHEAVYSMTPGAQWFSMCDTKNGYHQVMLHEDSRDYTCFMTPWGRYRFKRAPHGFIISGKKYNFEVDIALGGIQNIAKVVNDISCCMVTFPNHVKRVVEIFTRSREHGITLCPKKLVFVQLEVKFVRLHYRARRN